MHRTCSQNARASGWTAKKERRVSWKIHTCTEKYPMAVHAMRQEVCSYSKNQMYQLGPDVSIGFYGLLHVSPFKGTQMTIEAELVKHIVDIVLAALKKIKGVKVRRDAELGLGEVIRNLLQVSPDINGAEAKIQVAKAAGVISKELILAEEMLSSVRAKPRVRVVAKKVAAKAGYVAPKAAAKNTTAKRPFAAKSAQSVGRQSLAPIGVKKATAKAKRAASTAATRK